LNQQIPKSGRLAFCNQLIGNSSGFNLNGANYYLYVSSHTYSISDTLATYTAIEANPTYFPGKTATGWVPATIEVTENDGYSYANSVTWVNTSGSSVSFYGFFVSESTNTTLLMAGAFDSAPIVVPNGSSITIVPTFYFTSIY